MFYFPHDEERRPGITAIIDKVRAEHPRWKAIEVRFEAKLRWHAVNPGHPITGITLET